MISTEHPALANIQNVVAKRQQQPAPPIANKASNLLNPPLFNEVPTLAKKINKSVKAIKAIPEPLSPTRPTKIPHKFNLNHTSDSWKP